MVFVIFKYDWNVCLCLWLEKLINSRILSFDTLVGDENWTKETKVKHVWNIVDGEHFFFYFWILIYETENVEK